jgi:hypothetical protein
MMPLVDMKKCKRKAKDTSIQDRAPTPLKLGHGMAKTKFKTQKGSNQNSSFSMAKNHTPRETKTHKNKCQTQTMRPTPPEIENTKFHQFSFDKPQHKIRPLKQQGKENPFQK